MTALGWFLAGMVTLSVVSADASGRTRRVEPINVREVPDAPTE